MTPDSPPLIGINCDRFTDPITSITGVRSPYWQAVERAGGLPVLIPHLQNAAQASAIVDRLDGLLLTGGDDIPAERLGEPLPPTAVPMPGERDRTDFLLIEQVVQRGLPTLAICLGCQQLNVFFGGNLYLDLPHDGPSNLVRHFRKTGDRFVEHSIVIDPSTTLSTIWQDAGRAVVNSGHHQGIRELGRGLHAIAWAPDWLIEAVELPGHPFMLGVQWHPERMTGDLQQAALFDTLIERAGS